VTITVLAADDDADVLHLIEIKLGRAGFEVLTAADGETAVDLALAEQPDVVITEALLSKVDGLEVVRQIKENADPTPLVLILSGKDKDEDITAGLVSRADDFISKPFSPDVLLERIRVGLLRAEVPTTTE
jgi:DNA-binding response OmpR family regulator